MSNSKICPYCQNEIKATAKKCRYCKHWLEGNNIQKNIITSKQCPYCKNYIDIAASICMYCKSKLDEEDNNYEIREELKRYKELSNETLCLECGYQGIMGVVGKYVPWYASSWILIPIGILLMAIGCLPGTIVTIILLVLFNVSSTRYKLICPNCTSQLITK